MIRRKEFTPATAPTTLQVLPVSRQKVVSKDGGGLYDQAAARNGTPVMALMPASGRGLPASLGAAPAGTAGPTVKFLPVPR